MRIAMVVGVAGMLFGCAGKGEPPMAKPAELPAPTREMSQQRHGMRAPFVVSVDGPEDVQAGAVVEVKVRIQRRVPSELPLLLTVQAPEGLTIQQGVLSEEIVDETAPEVVRIFQVRVDDPSAVLTVQVTMGGEGFGAVATREHSFARTVKPATALPQPGELVRPLRR